MGGINGWLYWNDSVSGCKAGAVKQTESDQLSKMHFVNNFNATKNEELIKLKNI